MGEQGWQAFLSAESVDDWVVLHGGATAVFRVGSLGEALQLAQAIAQIPGLEDAGVLMTIADGTVTVRLTRDLWQLEARHIALARAVSAIAREHHAPADRSAVQEVQVAIAAKRTAIDIDFWRAVLGYVPVADDNAVDPHPAVAYALRALQHGSHVPEIATITEQLGISARHFSQLFRRQVGLTPKRFSRVRRFQAVLEQIHTVKDVHWADLALTCGYCDQAHFGHDFRAFAGLTPSDYRARQTDHRNHLGLDP
jgi:4a-hydroxytetrahydrobiopterin dehydratase